MLPLVRPGLQQHHDSVFIALVKYRVGDDDAGTGTTAFFLIDNYAHPCISFSV